jgi:hypothetical protein
MLISPWKIVPPIVKLPPKNLGIINLSFGKKGDILPQVCCDILPRRGLGV